MTKHPRLIFAAVTVMAILVPAASATAKIAVNHSETLLVDG